MTPALPRPAPPPAAVRLPAAALLAVLLLAACDRGPAARQDLRVAVDPVTASACESQVTADPEVRDLIMKGAGSERFKIENQYTLRRAEQRARIACLRARGVLPRGGGVEAQRPL